MSELDKDTSYLRATLKEMATRLQYPGSQSSVEIIRDGHVAAAILLLLDKVEALEGKTPEIHTKTGLWASNFDDLDPDTLLGCPTGRRKESDEAN
jgi:hypothetical protein